MKMAITYRLNLLETNFEAIVLKHKSRAGYIYCVLVFIRNQYETIQLANCVHP